MRCRFCLFLLLTSIVTISAVLPVATSYESKSEYGAGYVEPIISPAGVISPLATYQLDSDMTFKDVVLIPRNFSQQATYSRIGYEDPRPGQSETSEYMHGTVAAYVIFVESTGEYETELFDWTPTDIEWAKNGINYGLWWWMQKYPYKGYKLTFYVPRNTVIGYTGYEPFSHSIQDSKYWEENINKRVVVDVLSRLGCGSGSDALTMARTCADSIRRSWGTDWAFIIFVIDTGYLIPSWSDGARAYAYLNGPYVVLPFGWLYHVFFEGTEELGSFVAHEVGHIFGATDEYNNKTERGGYLYEEDNDGSGCIMDSPGDWCVSSGTARQIGWVDDNLNGYPDILENKIHIALYESPSPVVDSPVTTMRGVVWLEPYPCKKPNCRSVTINKVAFYNLTSQPTAYLELRATDGNFDSAFEEFTLIMRLNDVGHYSASVSFFDSIMFKSSSYLINFLYTYILVVDGKIFEHRERYDVGSAVTISYRLVFAHNYEPVTDASVKINGASAENMGDGWFKTHFVGLEVGSSEFLVDYVEASIKTHDGMGVVRKVEARTTPLKAIFDKVVVNLVAVKERVDVGSVAQVEANAFYAYDSQPFYGIIEISPDLKQDIVGAFTYKVTNIIDNRFGLTAYKANEVTVIFDRVRITLEANKVRVDVGSEAPISIKAVYEYDQKPFRGRVILNAPLKNEEIGLIRYEVVSIFDEEYGLSTFRANSVDVIFDAVVIELSAPPRVQLGKNAPIKYTAYYHYDSKPFKGDIILNEETYSDNLGPINYRVAKIIDYEYGLVRFISNEVTVVYDQVMAEKSAITFIPFSTEVIINTYYQYDKAPIDNALVTVNGKEAAKDTANPGAYKLTMFTLLPILQIDSEISTENFDIVTDRELIIHIGNIISYCIFLSLITAYLVKKRSKHVKPYFQITRICPICGSSNYIGYKEDGEWIYECLTCGHQMRIRQTK